MDSHLQRALQYIKQAVQEDSFGNYANAIQAYNMGIDLLREAQQEETNKEIVDAIGLKLLEYSDRVQIISKALVTSTPSTTTNSTVKPKTTQPAYRPSEQGAKNSKSDFDAMAKVILSESDDLLDSKATTKSFSNNGNKSLLDNSIFHQGRVGESSLETAVHLIVLAKEKDRNKEYVRAFELYTEALEHFSFAAKFVPAGVLPQLNRTMKIYLMRAEKIKIVMDKHGVSPNIKKVQLQEEETVERYHNRRVQECGFDGRVGSLKAQLRTNFWNDASPFMFQATINKNIFSLGESATIKIIIDNLGTIQVDSVMISLEQHITSTNVVAGSKKQVNTRVMAIGTQKYREKHGFPRGGGYFKNSMDYYIKPETSPTDCDNSAVFATEYKISVELEIPYHNPLKHSFNVRLIT
jgi:tetratricopeptide (TPR) repeat protein